MNTITSFYNDLLNEKKSPPDISTTLHALNDFMGDTNHPTLEDEDRLFLDQPLDINELDIALKSLNQDSSPGIDGLTPLFYIELWDLLREPLFQCFQEAVNFNLMSISQRRAIITLIPKDSEGPQNCNIANFRPLSLTCTDYKLYSRIFSSRLIAVIEKIININQVGYIPGRNISDHLRLIDDVINYSNRNNIKGMLTSLDFKKAFDSVNRNLIIAPLH